LEIKHLFLLVKIEDMNYPHQTAVIDQSLGSGDDDADHELAIEGPPQPKLQQVPLPTRGRGSRGRRKAIDSGRQ